MKVYLVRLGFYGVLAAGLLVASSSAPAFAGGQPRPASIASVSGGQAPKEVDLDELEDGLRETEAIGLATKLTLKSKLDSLIESFREFHQGKGDHRIQTLQERFGGLLNKTLALVREDDPRLFRRISAARRGLWLMVSDPVRFQAAIGYEDAFRVALRGGR
jgi:hypothetical protein